VLEGVGKKEMPSAGTERLSKKQLKHFKFYSSLPRESTLILEQFCSRPTK
jgi:hypothetical protein